MSACISLGSTLSAHAVTSVIRSMMAHSFENDEQSRRGSGGAAMLATLRASARASPKTWTRGHGAAVWRPAGRPRIAVRRQALDQRCTAAVASLVETEKTAWLLVGQRNSIILAKWTHDPRTSIAVRLDR